MDIKLVLVLICVGICCARRNRPPFLGQIIDSSEEDSREDWQSSIVDRRNILESIIQSTRRPGYASRWNIPGFGLDRRPYFDSGSEGGLFSLRPSSIFRPLQLLGIVQRLINGPLGQVGSLYQTASNLPTQLLRPVFNRGEDEGVPPSNVEASDGGLEDRKDIPNTAEIAGGDTPKLESGDAGTVDKPIAAAGASD